MKNSYLLSRFENKTLSLVFQGELTIYTITTFQKEVEKFNYDDVTMVIIDLNNVNYIDTAAAILISKIQYKVNKQKIKLKLLCENENFLQTIYLVEDKIDFKTPVLETKSETFLEKTGYIFVEYYRGFIDFITFFGELFATKFRYLTSLHKIRYKEIFFEMNESALKALGIIALTSFLIGLVVAYQSAYQLKLYGANIFIVDMLGISIFRELAPLITAIVIAGRSGSSYTAQIGAMKITQEIDAMRTMGFEPFAFLVLPRIIALMITMPLLIFVADMMAIFGGMIVANVDLHITPQLFIDRLNEVVAAKHFFIGLIKGPFFAFLIATIGIYRGLMVKDDTQSIGFNTTKSVVESIFAVIVCDAVFSIAFTNLGI